MLPSQQVRDGENSAPARVSSPAPASWERMGWDQEGLAVESRRGSPSSSPVVAASDATRPTRRLVTGFWTRALGTAGLVLGAAAAGVIAHQMGYDWRLTSIIAALVGIAGGSVGVMLPLVIRALGWALLAALVGSVGAAALYLLLHVAPVFVERFVR